MSYQEDIPIRNTGLNAKVPRKPLPLSTKARRKRREGLASTPSVHAHEDMTEQEEEEAAIHLFMHMIGDG